MAKDKRHFNVLSLDTIINLYFVIIVFFQFQKLGKCQNEKQFMPRKLFQFHTSSMVNLLRQKLLPNVQRRLFFFGRNCDLEFTQFLEPVKNQKKHQGCINDGEALGSDVLFFFPFLLDDWTWKLHQAAFPWGHSRKSWKKMVERKLWWVDFPQHFDKNLVFSAAEIAWSQRLFCDVALPCLMVYDCKGCANWSQSPSKVPAVPPGTQAAWAGGTRGCMKPSKISGARLVRWVWEVCHD